MAAVGACTSPGRGARDRQLRSAEGTGAGSSALAFVPLRRTNSVGRNAGRAAEEGTRAAPASPRGGLRLPSPAGLPGVHCSQWSLRDGKRRVR